jgi:hypothetical protein
MKVGAENSKKTLIAVGLFVLALILVARMFFTGGSSSSTATPSPAAAVTPSKSATPRHAARGGKQSAKTKVPASATPNLDPRLRLKQLQEAEGTDYTGKGRNIFLAQASEPVDIPKPVVTPIKKAEPPPPQVYTPPPPPPIDLKFFGFASTQGIKRVFLSRGDDVFIAGEGDIVNRRYKIMKINANNIEVLDVLSNNQQTIPLTAS